MSHPARTTHAQDAQYPRPDKAGILNHALRASCVALLLGALAMPSPAASDLDWPEITSQTKPWTRWWWLGSIGTKEDFSSEMEKYAKAGLGGLEITPIYGVRGQEDRFRQYLSPQWMDLLDHVLDEAQRLDLGIDMATGNGWPFGGPWVDARDAARHIVTKTYTVKSGLRLAEKITATDQPLVRVAGRRRADISELKDPVASNTNLQDLALDQARFPRKLQLQALVAYSASGDQKINLTDKVDADGRLDWTAPEGDWTLCAVFMGWHGKQVERAGPGGEGDVIDHFSSASLANYLKRFDEAYANHRANRLRAYFNDSYEVDDASGEANWTPRFFDEFKRRRGYDLRDELPAFLGNDTEEKNSRVISDHRETISDLLLDEFTVPWAKWAATHNAVIRNQAHGSPANIIDLYAASGIPETEGTNIVGMKLASSAAHVTGKPLTGAETATWLDEHWVSTLDDIKRRVDLMFLGGVNFNCYHGTAFSPPDESWPGHQFYASVELNPANPIWADSAALNGYVARVQSFLQADKPGNDILFYFPIHDIWSQRGNGAMPHFSQSGRLGSTQTVAQELLDRGYAFDFITDRLLADVQVRDGALVTGGSRYRVVLVPEMKFMPLETLRQLRRLAEAGATIVFLKSFPEDVPGLGQLEARRAAFKANIKTFREGATESDGITISPLDKGRLLLGRDLEKLLARAGVARESLVDCGLHFERRVHGKGHTYFLLNRGENSFEGWVPLQAGTRAAALFDALRAERGRAALRTGTGGRPEIFLRLAPAESVIVKSFTTPIEGPDFPYWKTAGTPEPIMGEWELRFTSGGPTLPAARKMPELKSWTRLEGPDCQAFSGTAVYRIAFARPAARATAWRLDLGRVGESARVTLNGRELAVLFSPPFQLTLPDGLLAAQNTLEIAVTNLAVNRIADLDRRDSGWKKFYNINYPARIAKNRGADGNFSAAKWTPRDSGLLGPVALTPMERFAPAPNPLPAAAGAAADGKTIDTPAVQPAIGRPTGQMPAPARHPILPDFHADPSARVFDGKLYIYPSHDAAGARNWKGMVDWHVFSTEDMVKWTDHGVISSLKDIAWADTEAWAPDCIERNGKYYFYFPAGGQIGVAVSDSPTGPFKDALGQPLVKKNEAGIRYMIDPNVFIDDDGQAYLYVGGAYQLGVVKLKEDMITRDGPIQMLDMPKFYEGAWVHKRKGIYYASYPIRPKGREGQANVMAYSTAQSPLGPWEYKGEILDNRSLNIHGSITEFKGQWYLFHHVAGPSNWERRVCVEPLSYNEDGSIKPIRIAKGTADADGLKTVPPIGGASGMGGSPGPPNPVAAPPGAKTPARSVTLCPLTSVRLLEGSPFAAAIAANRAYLLAHNPDRLLAPFLREAGLEPRAPSYENWENIGLDGHTAGHYLAALANMIASGADTPGRELQRRLDYMLAELERCQKANGDGYIGGIPGGRAFWADLAAGRFQAQRFEINGKWVPWYNIHKTFAGLRDACAGTGSGKARELLIRLGDWAERVTSGLSDQQMQDMLGAEHGGMNEVLADLHVMTGDEKYLRAARRFHHHAVLDPLIAHKDELTRKHANTQIPKVIGLERIAALTGDKEGGSGARFFWETVVRTRSVAFGGNSVAEHFNDPKNFLPVIESREGPETCNTYNMLRLTEQLFSSSPDASYADYYERALFNHILSSIHPDHPGYVYFTPLRPGHYRVYSQPEQGFWCCVGTGMENPGKYGQFIYAQAGDGLYVNLFIASELTVADSGLTLRQETSFPDEERTRLSLKLDRPATFALHLRHPAWVAEDAFAVRVNGRPVEVKSKPSSYAAIRREWRDGDRVELELPMRTTAEALPDGSPWHAILRGPILLAAPTGTDDLDGLRAGPGRGDHKPNGRLVPLDQMPSLLTTPDALPDHVKSDSAAGPLRFRLVDIVEPASAGGLPLMPFFRLHDSRYQMYWHLTSPEDFAGRKQQLAAEERVKLARETATLDSVAIGEQQPEVDHAFAGEDTETGVLRGRVWRHGKWFEYTLQTRDEKAVDLVVTYWGGDQNRRFQITANGKFLSEEALNGSARDRFIDKRYVIPADLLAKAENGVLRIRFIAEPGSLVGGVYDLRLMRPETTRE
ncbi:glycoside hydrolase family 127 protein [Termitidicoccus mucosus]|uniref:beta-L-arabinofuranosidase domain-containing protein n=1 Tax=Termitidicoccus mucosus TaxID=1184151 RepID=UPI0031833419